MKLGTIVLAAVSLVLVAGCASEPKAPEKTLEAGMTREQLKLYFGDPLRIEPVAAGGENWYYRFASWKTQPAGVTGTTGGFNDQTSYVGVGLQFSRPAVERPVHISPNGYVVEPLPAGKIVRN